MLALIIGHLIGDYYLQWDALIQLKKTSFKYLLLHVLIYILPFVGLVFVFRYSLVDWVLPLSIVFISHMLIDIGKKYLDQWLCDKKFVFMNFCIDQLFHLLVLGLYSQYFVIRSWWIWGVFIVVMIFQPIPLIKKLYSISHKKRF